MMKTWNSRKYVAHFYVTVQRKRHQGFVSATNTHLMASDFRVYVNTG